MSYFVLLVVAVLVLVGPMLPLRAEAESTQPSHVVAQASQQVERGRTTFSNACARCHGAQGQGGSDGPRLIGTPNGLKEHQNALKLFDFVKTNMPVSAPGSLPDEQYWDVLAFILDGNRLLPPDVTLGPETAERVTLTP